MYDKSRSECFGFLRDWWLVASDWWLVTSDWWLVTGDYIPPSGIATIYTLRRFYIFMRRTNPFEPLEPAEPLSHAIKGRSAPRANPEVDSLLSTFPSAIFSFWERIVNFKDFGGQISHFTEKWEERKGKDGTKLGYLGWEMESARGWQSGGKRNA